MNRENQFEFGNVNRQKYLMLGCTILVYLIILMAS
jgi:hypothetical protein